MESFISFQNYIKSQHGCHDEIGGCVLYHSKITSNHNVVHTVHKTIWVLYHSKITSNHNYEPSLVLSPQVLYHSKITSNHNVKK